MSTRARHPEAWLWIVGAAGWVALAAHEVAGRLPTSAGHHGMAMDHAGMSTGSAGSPTWLAGASMQAAMWAAMIAIMAPLIAPNVRFVALRSPLVLRRRVTLAVVAGWSVAWVVAAMVLGTGTWLAIRVVGDAAAIAGFVAVAVLWQMTPTKRRVAARCHRTCAPPLDADQAAVVCGRFGLRLGLDCVASCWALMAAMAAAGHALVAVVPLFWVSWYERRRRPHHDPGTRLATGVMACTGVTLVALVALTPWLA